MSSPRAGLAGFEGNAALSASSRANFSAFLVASAFLRSSSASTFAFDFAPLDHSFASFRSSSCCAFAIRASLAAAFYINISVMFVKLGRALLHCRLLSLCSR